jgi:hypothetical protein
MATRIVVCPECGVPVPYGRLSCPECGSLLASVVGVSRRVTPVTVAEAAVASSTFVAPPPFPLPAVPLPLPPIAPPSPPTVAPGPAPARPSQPARAASRTVAPPASPPPSGRMAGASTVAEVLGEASTVPTAPRPAAPPPAAPAPAATRTTTRRRPTRINEPSPRLAGDGRPESDEALPLGRWDLAGALPPAPVGELTAAPIVEAPAPRPALDAMPAPIPAPPPEATLAPAAPQAPGRPATRAPRLSPAFAASVAPPKPQPLTSPSPLTSSSPQASSALDRAPVTPSRAPMTAPLSAPSAPVAAPAGEPAWPTNAAVPAVTPRRAPDRTRSTPKPLTGKPTNGATGVAHPAAIVDGPPVPIWPPEPAGEPLPPSAVFAGAPDVDDGLATTTTGSTLAPASPRPPSMAGPTGASRLRLPKLGELQFDVPANLADWLITAGSGVALVGFLLPWSDAVVGAKGFGGYTDSWGLAVPSHLIVLVVLGAVLTLAVMPNRVPSWIRTGVLGVLVGGLLVGLIWPYVIGGLGASLGVLFELVGAVLLVAGGVADRRAARHGDLPDSV